MMGSSSSGKTLLSQGRDEGSIPSESKHEAPVAQLEKERIPPKDEAAGSTPAGSANHPLPQ